MEIILIVFAIAIIINIVLLVIFSKKVDKLNKMYEKTLHKFDGENNVKDTFEDMFKRLNEVEVFCNETNENYEKCKEEVSAAISKIGLVKYSALDEYDDNMSFVLAQLNKKNTGTIINYVFSSHGSTMYVKKVKNGIVSERISEEEAEAIKIASSSQAKQEVEPFYKPKISKVNLKKRK